MTLPFRGPTEPWPPGFEIPSEEQSIEVLRQWIAEVTGFSSEYGEGVGAWSASQIAGPPRVQAYGDDGLAWAPATIGRGTEWLELRIARACQVQRVRIRESLCGGAFHRLKLFDPDSKQFVTVVEREPRCGQYPHEIRIEDIEVPLERQVMTDRIRLELDPRRGRNWYEIDAVQVIGASQPVLQTLIAPIVKRQSILAQQISTLMNDQNTADCTLVVENGMHPIVRIPVHRGILAARCPLFRAMLNNKELPLGGEKIIQDIEPALVKKIIEWIYTGNVEHLDRYDCVSLVSASDYLQIDDLTEFCVAVFKSLLTVQNAALLYAHFECLGIGPLKEAALGYCGKSFLAVSQTSEFQHLTQPQLLAVVQHYGQQTDTATTTENHIAPQHQQAAEMDDGNGDGDY